jgi:hypothetical protein
MMACCLGGIEGPYICIDIGLLSFQHIISGLNYQGVFQMVSFSLARLLRMRIRDQSNYTHSSATILKPQLDSHRQE